jgi:hypothetical protein
MVESAQLLASAEIRRKKVSGTMPDRGH